MKKILTAAVAVLALAACNKNIPAVETMSELTAIVEGGLTRSHLDGNQVLWDANDEISVFSQADGAYTHAKFATAESGASAVFKGPGVNVDEQLYALYPYAEGNTFATGTGFTIQADYAAQKVVDGSFDQKINLAAGHYSGGKNVSFRNVGALLSFTLTQERADTIRRIEIQSNDGTPLAFSGQATVQWNDGAPAVALAADAAPADVIRLSPAAETFTTGSTYYVWVLPGEYAKGITVTLVSPTQMTAVKAGATALKAGRNQVVNLGEIGGLEFKAKESEKLALHFDFSGTPLDGWPTADKWKEGPGELPCIYPLDGVAYEFFLTDVGNASQARLCWDSAKGGLVWYAGWRYLGLPAVENFRLIKVSGVMCLSTNSKRKAGVVENVCPDNTDMDIASAHTFVTGGESTGWTEKGQTYTFNLEGTQPGTRYYLMCTATSMGVSSLDLVYEKVE